MTELIKVTEENGSKLVSARELHEFLESKQDFTTWIKGRIDKYGFIENEDFTLHKFMVGKSVAHNYILKMDMAKELSMVENNDKGTFKGIPATIWSPFAHSCGRACPHAAVAASFPGFELPASVVVTPDRATRSRQRHSP